MRPGVSHRMDLPASTKTSDDIAAEVARFLAEGGAITKPTQGESLLPRKTLWGSANRTKAKVK